MSTMYMSQLSTLPLLEGDQDQGHLPAYALAKEHPILFPFVIANPRGQEPSYGGRSDQHPRQRVLLYRTPTLIGGSNVSPVPPPPAVQTIGDDMIRRPSYGSYAGRTGERTPVKMAVMRKTDAEGGAVKKPRRRSSQAQQNNRQISTNQEQQQHHQAMGVIRVCSDCNTTKTPLWRSGPRGPKSLCNACGIRQRKARRAAVAAAAAVHVPGLRKEKRPDAAQPLPFKKRCKMAAGHHVDAPKNALLGDSPVNASKSGVACARAPLQEQDEITDAAILLMALSCGLVRS